MITTVGAGGASVSLMTAVSESDGLSLSEASVIVADTVIGISVSGAGYEVLYPLSIISCVTVTGVTVPSGSVTLSISPTSVSVGSVIVTFTSPSNSSVVMFPSSLISSVITTVGASVGVSSVIVTAESSTSPSLASLFGSGE